MVVALLLLAIGLLFVPNHALHVSVFLLHALYLLIFSTRRFKSQPLVALFIFAYIGMYFFNPLAISLGLMPIEYGTSWKIFFTANALVLIGIDLFVISATYFRRTSSDLTSIPHTLVNRQTVDNITLGIVLLCAGMTAVLTVAIFALGANIFEVDKSFRTGFGPHQIWYNATVFAFVILPIAGFFIGLRKLGAQLNYLFVILALLVVHFMIFRVRTVPIAFLIGYGVGIYAGYRHVSLIGDAIIPRIPKLLKILILVAIPLGVVLGVGIKYLRYSHDLNDYTLDRARFEYVMVHTFSGGDLGYTLFLRQGMRLYPDRERHLGGQSYYRLLFTPIPRTVWPAKPENTQRIFARAIDPELGRKGVTIPPGIVGDLYINFGKVGVAGMIVFGLIFRLERYHGIGSLIFVATSGGWLFHFTRGALTNPLIWILWITIVIWVLLRVLKPMYYSYWPQQGEAVGQPYAA